MDHEEGGGVLPSTVSPHTCIMMHASRATHPFRGIYMMDVLQFRGSGTKTNGLGRGFVGF